MKKKKVIGSFVLLTAILIGIAGIYYHDKGVTKKESELITYYYKSMNIDASYWVDVRKEWHAYPADVQTKFLRSHNVKAVFKIFDTNRKSCGNVILFRSGENEKKFQTLLNEDLKVWSLILSKT